MFVLLARTCSLFHCAFFKYKQNCQANLDIIDWFCLWRITLVFNQKFSGSYFCLPFDIYWWAWHQWFPHLYQGDQFDILEDIHHTCSASFKSWQMTALGLTGWIVCGLRVKHHENCFGQKKLLWLHQTLRKSVMVTSNIKKICYGHIKHFEKTVMVTSNIENI